MIKRSFVAVAVRAGECQRKDAVGEFLRQSGIRLIGASGQKFCLTASGRRLKPDPHKAYQQWMSLPAAERRPGAVQVPKLSAVDTRWAIPKPPAGGLILKLYYRTLVRDPDGELRHITYKDYFHNGVHLFKEALGNVEHWKQKKMFVRQLQNKAFFEAHPDSMWLTKAEWQSLIPASPQKGQQFPMPVEIAKRMCRHHLHPALTVGEATGWYYRNYLRAAQMTLIVEEASPERVRLRLEGFARVGLDFDAAQKKIQEGKAGLGYEPSLLGYIDYDRKQQKITCFDMVALGDSYGMLGEKGYQRYRPGRTPLGITFELASPDVPANRVPPRAAMAGPQGYQNYFSSSRF